MKPPKFTTDLPFPLFALSGSHESTWRGNDAIRGNECRNNPFQAQGSKAWTFMAASVVDPHGVQQFGDHWRNLFFPRQTSSYPIKRSGDDRPSTALSGSSALLFLWIKDQTKFISLKASWSKPNFDRLKAT